MELLPIVEAVRTSPGVTRKRAIKDIVKLLPVESFVSVAASEGEDAAAIEFGNDYILFATDGIMESLVKTDPFSAGYYAVLVNVNDIAAMGGHPLAMVDVMSIKDGKVCSQILKGMESAVKKFNVPIVGGHTHPDCQYQAIDISIVGTVPKDDLIRSSTAQAGDDIVFVMDLDGYYPQNLPAVWETTRKKDAIIVQKQMAAMCEVGKRKLCNSAKDMSNPGCIGTLGMMLETSRKGGRVDINKIPIPKDENNFIQWILAYQGCGFVFSCNPSKSQEIIELFEDVGCTGAVVGKVDDTCLMVLESEGKEELLFDFSKDIITGCSPHKI